MRSIIRVGLRAFRTPLSILAFPPTLTTHARFSFAKVSKKEEQRSEKKKEKSQAKESLGGDTSEIDLNKYEESYSAVLVAFREQLSTIRFGRLDAASIASAQVKLGNENMQLSALAQVSAKSANTCVVSPFDSSHTDLIERSLRIWDDSLEIKRGENALTLTQAAQGKEARDKMVQRVKKLANDRKEELKKLRSATQEELRKYKKIVPEDRLRTIEAEAKAMFDKKSQDIEKLEKEKEKELMK
jgi:ribosome recycling factor